MRQRSRRPDPRRRALFTGEGAAPAATSSRSVTRNRRAVGHWDGADGRARYEAAYRTAMAELPGPERTLDVRTGHGTVRVYRFAGRAGHGHPYPLVLLPGRASATPVWADNLPSLLEGGDVYTIDLLGEPGMSVQEEPLENDADQAAWLSGTLRALPEDRFHLVGLSVGGWSAVNLALHDAGKIATLSLIDPVHVFADMPLRTVIRSLPASLPWLPKSWRDAFNSYTAGGAPVEEIAVAAMIEAGMQHYRMQLPQPARIPEDRLGELRMPVLAVIAGRSVMHDAGSAVSTADRVLPDGTVHHYRYASHAVNGEEPQRLAADLARFLARQR
ncbi:alpha/beta fold hydrolase [Streptomyces atroolivaceus]|uniref:alpha/beta fold hydrolase n=1 Tax=Streptomyces atroolivaceus TaxID=66869 RepID=UPI0037BA9602